MSMTVTEAKDKIRAIGLRATTPRIAVLRCFAEATRPLSHSDMVNSLGQLHGDQATLYRILIKFTEFGLIRVTSRAGGIARYELCTGDADEAQHMHPHFICNDCGDVSCLPETTVITSVDEEWRGILKASELQFVGQCPECHP